ncbi:MAG: MFS transporter [Spirochaetales bacterium]|nr:MFS transporter [Spirochaetales bacterium]
MEIRSETKNQQFKKREIVTVYISGFMILMNLMVSLTLFPLYVKHRGGSDFMVGLQSGIFTLSSVVFRLYFGPLADSVGRRFPLLLGSFIFATAPILIWLSPNFFFMSLARVYQAVGMATFLSAAGSAIADMVSVERRSTAIGLYRSMAASTFMVGSYFGFYLINNFGFPLFFIALSSSSLFGMLILFTVRLPDGDMKTSGGAVKPADLLSLIKNRDLRGSYVGIILSASSSAAVLTYTAVYFSTINNSISLPMFFTIYGLSGIIGSTVSGYLSGRIKRIYMVVPLTFIFSLGVILLGASCLANSPLYLVVPVFIAFGYSGSITNFSTWIVDSAPSTLRASALSFQESSMDIGTTIGSFIFGILALKFYYGPLFIALGLLTFTFPLVIKVVRR